MGKYTKDQITSRLGQIPGWDITPDSGSIERSLVLKNFVACVDLINKIKDIAEKQNHHPDLHLTGYKNLKIVLYTHTAGGVTENDFQLAAKINEICLK